MNKPFAYLVEHRLKRKRRDTGQLVAQLAPLEEQTRGQEETAMARAATIEQGMGAIVIDNDAHNLSKDLVDSSVAGGGLWRMEPVVLLIVGLMLAFIAFIAWQVSQMPGE
jgi:hypothetical protein